MLDLPENTVHCTRKQHSRLLSLFSREINHRMYQIYKEDGVVNRFLTARRHFSTPWSERTHYMENGQLVFFLLASPALRIRACEAHALALTLFLPYPKPILGKKNPTVLQSKIRATLAITELYATNEIMIKKHITS